MIDYTKILIANYPGAQWTLNGDNYDGLTWLDSTKKPTQAELDAAWPTVAYNDQVTQVETTRTNAPIKIKNSALTRCSTITQCERVAND